MTHDVKIMGILNVTPDSFSDGGKFFEPKTSAAHAKKLIEEGADIIDIGGESSGPGSVDVPAEEELRRVIPVIKKIHYSLLSASTRFYPLLSIDTHKAEVARQAIAAGVRMVNDVTALRGDRDTAAVVAETGVPIILMYSKDPTARTTRRAVQYKDVVKIISDFLQKRIDFAFHAGIRREQIIIDPGMGNFVSSESHYSWEILERLHEFKRLGFPILIGASRKSFLGEELNGRLQKTLEANQLAIQNGASIIRVHDIAPHKKLIGTKTKTRQFQIASRAMHETHQ